MHGSALISNKEQHRAANVLLKSDVATSRTGVTLASMQWMLKYGKGESTPLPNNVNDMFTAGMEVIVSCYCRLLIRLIDSYQFCH